MGSSERSAKCIFTGLVLSALCGLCVKLYAQTPPAPVIQRYVIATHDGLVGIEARDGVAVAGLKAIYNPPDGAGALVDFAVRGDRAYVLYESGAIQNLGQGPSIEGYALAVGKATALEISNDLQSLFILDDAGGLNVAGGTAPEWLSGNRSGTFLPKALVLVNQGAWLLDGGGAVHSLGGAPPLNTSFADDVSPIDLKQDPDGNACMLDHRGFVYLLSSDVPPKVIFRSEANDSLPVALAFDPVTGNPVVLRENGRMENTDLPAIRQHVSPATDLEFLSDGGAPLVGFERTETRLMLDGSQRSVNLVDESFLMPIKILSAFDIAMLQFRLRLDPAHLAYRGGIFKSETLVPADARIQTETSAAKPGELWVQIVCGAAPEAGAIEGTGSLILLDLAPVAPGDATMSLDQFRWSARESKRFAEIPAPATTVIRILNPPPYAELKLLRQQGQEGDGSEKLPLRVLIGTRLEVEFRVESVRGLAGAAFDFAFDAERLSLVSLTEGEFLSRAGPTASHLGRLDTLNAKGRANALAVTLLGETAGVRGGGSVARAVFVARAPGRAAISLAKVRGMAADGTPMEIPSTGGSLVLEVR